MAILSAWTLIRRIGTRRSSLSSTPSTPTKEVRQGCPAIDWEADANDKNRLWFGQEGVRVAEWWRREDVASKLLKLSDGTVIFEGKYQNFSPF